MKIGNFEVGSKSLIIAEIGNNHLGDVDLAFKTLDAAIHAGVDAIKFQLFKPEQLVTAIMPVLSHVPDNRFPTQRERFKHMILGKDQFIELAKKANEKNVLFLCTPFDAESADFLDQIVPAFKLASGDTTNFPLIDHVVKKGKPIFMSTGFCDQEEIDSLVKRLPKERSVLLHCIGAYPTPDNDVCLSLIPYYKERYKLPIGFSDHTSDLLAPVSAVAMGAVVIEKHFILDKNLPGGDRDLSLNPDEMEKMISQIRRLEAMMNKPPRILQPSEVTFKTNLRRSPYTRSKVRKGDILNMNDLIFLRPEIEESHKISDIIKGVGLKITCDLEAEELLHQKNSEIIYK